MPMNQAAGCWIMPKKSTGCASRSPGNARRAASLAGTSQDVRDLISYRLNLGGFDDGELPLLAQGWRAEVVGQVIDHLLSGDLSIRIADPLQDEPLVFEKR